MKTKEIGQKNLENLHSQRSIFELQRRKMFISEQILKLQNSYSSRGPKAQQKTDRPPARTKKTHQPSTTKRRLSDISIYHLTNKMSHYTDAADVPKIVAAVRETSRSGTARCVRKYAVLIKIRCSLSGNGATLFIIFRPSLRMSLLLYQYTVMMVL